MFKPHICILLYRKYKQKAVCGMILSKFQDTIELYTTTTFPERG